VSLSQKKEQKKAIEEVKKAIELDPAFAEAHENLTKLILSSNTDTRQFWQFWMTSKKRLVVPIILGVLAAGLVLYSLYTGSEVMTTNEEIKDGKRSITINTSREHKIPETEGPFNINPGAALPSSKAFTPLRSKVDEKENY
jgi:hypothetical protein